MDSANSITSINELDDELLIVNEVGEVLNKGKYSPRKPSSLTGLHQVGQD